MRRLPAVNVIKLFFFVTDDVEKWPEHLPLAGNFQVGIMFASTTEAKPNRAFR
jgi:hypothetical protein